VLALACGALCIAVLAGIQWVNMRARCVEAEATILAVLPDALGTSETVEVAFSPRYAFTCREMLVVEHALPDRSQDGVSSTLEGLRASLAILDQTGTAILDQELAAESAGAFVVRSGRDEVLPAFFFTPVPKGDYRLRLTVSRPSVALAAVPHRVVARYELCGIEHLATNMAGGMALVALMLFLGLVTWLRRPRRG
jgi:hypothetical protein